MPDKDSNQQTPDNPETPDASEASSQGLPNEEADRSQRKEELEALFEAWSKRREDELPGVALDTDNSSHGRRDPVVWRSIFLLLILVMSTGLIYFTYSDFMYWLQAPEEPTDLGDLGERFRAGEKHLDVTSNSYVSVRGLFMTYELQAEGSDKAEDVKPETSQDGSRKYFICPMFDVAVQTTRPLPEKAWNRNVEIDGDFIDLINHRRAFPQDLTVTFEGRGRIFRLNEAPSWAQRMVRRWYVEDLGVPLDGERALVFLDGEVPGKYSKYAYFWAFGVLAPVVPFFLLIRALRRRREALAAIAGSSPSASEPTG